MDIREFLKQLTGKKRGDLYILEGVSTEFYMVFDVSDGFDEKGVCDVLVVEPTKLPTEGIRIAMDLMPKQVVRLLFAMCLGTKLPEPANTVCWVMLDLT